MRIHPGTAFVLTAVLFGGGLAVHEKREDAVVAPSQTPAVHTPTPEPLMPHRAAVASSEAWREAWHFDKKTVCIDSSIPNAPLAQVASMFSGASKGGLTVVLGGKAGGCATKGYPASQRTSFLSMSPNQQATSGACAFTAPSYYASTGNVATMSISVWLTGATSTPCGGGLEWLDVFAHEFGHAVGLSHAQPAVTSIMRDGHSLDYGDRTRVASIYSSRSL